MSQIQGQGLDPLPVKVLLLLLADSGGQVTLLLLLYQPEVEWGGNLKSISHRCYFFEEASVYELTKEAIHLPLSCLQGVYTPA